MLPIDRQNKILHWLTDEKTLKISEISKRLNVSEMTVYRDIKILVDQEKVERTPNGIKEPSSSLYSNQCSVCFKQSTTRHALTCVFANQRVETVCCPHCAMLLVERAGDDLVQLIGQDYLLDTTFNAKMGYYVVGSDVRMSCCEPQVLLFSTKRDAEKFQTGFGGELYSFEDTVAYITRQMTGGCCSKKK